MAQGEPDSAPSHPPAVSLGGGDIAFLVTLVLALAGVGLSGQFAYRQGTLLEAAKANAQALVAWAESAAGEAGKEGPWSLAQCQPAPDTPQDGATPASAQTASAPVSWVACRAALFGPQGLLADLHNPFDARHPPTGGQCERKKPAARGMVVVEKGLPPPPGMPLPMTWAPLADEEPLVHGMALRVQVCDGGGYPIRIAELKL